MTLPPDPTLFLAHCKAHKTPTQSQPCKELKMPTPHAHPPPSGRDSYELQLKHQQNNNLSATHDNLTPSTLLL